MVGGLEGVVGFAHGGAGRGRLAEVEVLAQTTKGPRVYGSLEAS